jgi:uncharacterized membrane protein YtjA (UPF0391 family)
MRAVARARAMRAAKPRAVSEPPAACVLRSHMRHGENMFRQSLLMFALAALAGLVGFSGITGGFTTFAKAICIILLVMSLTTLVVALLRRR